jgi:tetratricopeptide (TPR) repeat protein
MFRRPRPLRQRRRPGPLGPAGQKRAQARELFERGDYGAAADAFEELAQGAEQRGMLDRAGDLRMRVAQCYLKLENIDRADDEAGRALRLYLRARRPRKVRRLLPKVIATLEKHGRHEEAKELREKAEQLLGAAPGGPDALRPGMLGPRGTLPGKCPNCGGPIKPGEVNWVGRGSAECPYCGSVVNTARPA